MSEQKTILSKIKELKDYVVNLGKETQLEETQEVEKVEAKETEVVEVVEVKETNEYVTVAEFAQAMEDIKTLFSKQYEKFEAEKKELETEKAELSRQLDEKPDAEKIITAPVEQVKLSATTTRGRLYEFLNSKK